MDERRDAYIEALDDVCRAVTLTNERNQQILERAGAMQQRWKMDGYPGTVAAAEDRPLIVELMRENLQTLSKASSRLRRAQVMALYEEGATTDQIAKLFGVTRQRISTVLKEARARALEPSG